MTDSELAQAYTHVAGIEEHARSRIGNIDQIEHHTAIAVVRLAVPLKRQLETWITQRACRAAVNS